MTVTAPDRADSESPAAALLCYLLAPLDEWLADPATEEVAINRPGEVWVAAARRLCAP